MSRTTLPEWDTGVELHLTKHQRRFIAAKVIKGLRAARTNRERVEAKYGEDAVHATHVIDSLTRLGYKVGLTDEHMAEPEPEGVEA